MTQEQINSFYSEPYVIGNLVFDSGADLSSQNLSDLDLKHVNLRDSNLQNIYLQN